MSKIRKFELKAQKNCESLSFEQSPVTMGRSLQASVVLRNVLMSREHSVISWEENKEKWIILDKSTSGTFINDKLVGKGQSHELNHGDVICLAPSTEAKCIAWTFHCEQPVLMNVTNLHFKNSSSDTESAELIDLPRMELDYQHSQAFTEMKNEKTDLESRRHAKLQSLRRMEQEYQKKEEQFNERLKNIQERQITNPAKKAKLDEEEAIKRQWESEKNQLLEEISSNKAAEENLKSEVERLQSCLDYVKTEWEQKMEKMKLEVEEAHRSKSDAVQAARQEMTAASNQLQESLEQRLKKNEEEKQKLEDALKQKETDLLAAQQQSAKAEMARQQDNQMEDFQSELQCVICSELFVTAMNLNCMHTFCNYCLMQWTKNNKTCPSCRTPITSKARSLVTDNVVALVVAKMSDQMKAERQVLVDERKQLENPPPPPTRGRGRQRGGRGRGRGGNRTSAAAVAAVAAAAGDAVDAIIRSIAAGSSGAVVRPPVVDLASPTRPRAGTRALVNPHVSESATAQRVWADNLVAARASRANDSATVQVPRNPPPGAPTPARMPFDNVQEEVEVTTSTSAPEGVEVATTSNVAVQVEVPSTTRRRRRRIRSPSYSSDDSNNGRIRSPSDDDSDDDDSNNSRSNSSDGGDSQEHSDRFSIPGEEINPSDLDLSDDLEEDAPVRTYGACYVCNSPNHWAPECPHRRRPRHYF